MEPMEVDYSKSLDVPSSELLSAPLSVNLRMTSDMELISADRLDEKTYTVNPPEDIFVLGMLVSIKCGVTGATFKSWYGTQGKNSATGGRAAQSARSSPVSKNKPYYRLLQFADIGSGSLGKMFAVALNSSHAQSRFFADQKTYFGVGSIWVIVEPDSADGRLGEQPDCPVVFNDWNGVCYPLNMATSLEVFPARFVPTVEMQKSHETKEQRFFCYHGVNDLLVTYANIMQAQCSGLMCDQQSSDLMQKCGCATRHHHGSMKVMSMTVTISVSSTVCMDMQISIKGFRSGKTGKLFIDDDAFDKYSEKRPDDRIELRKAVKAIVKVVNENCGWTVVGWTKLGEIKDESMPDGQGIVFVNHDMKPHIVYLYPTDPRTVMPLVEPHRLVYSDDKIKYPYVDPTVNQQHPPGQQNGNGAGNNGNSANDGSNSTTVTNQHRGPHTRRSRGTVTA